MKHIETHLEHCRFHLVVFHVLNIAILVLVSVGYIIPRTRTYIIKLLLFLTLNQNLIFLDQSELVL